MKMILLLKWMKRMMLDKHYLDIRCDEVQEDFRHNKTGHLIEDRKLAVKPTFRSFSFLNSLAAKNVGGGF